MSFTVTTSRRNIRGSEMRAVGSTIGSPHASSENEGALFFQLQGNESISSQPNHQISWPIPLHGRFDLPNHAKNRANTRGPSRQCQWTFTVHVPKTREALAKHVFEFFDQTAATFSLRRTTRLVFQRRGANCNCDRQTLDHSKYDLWDSNGARKYRLFRRRRANDSRACWRISGAALSGSYRDASICRSLHGARWSQNRIACCRVNQS